MVFCNRCGKETDTLYSTGVLGMALCEECRDTFSAWLNRKVIQGDETQAQTNLMLHQSNRKLENENFELKAKLKELESKSKVIDTGRSRLVGLTEAQEVLTANDYIFYKKPENWGKWNKGKQQTKRKRRTKAEIEQDRQREVGQ